MREVKIGGHRKHSMIKGYAKVDNVDFDAINAYKWSYIRGYAYRHYKKGGKKTTIFMHREIMGSPDGLEIDHIDGNKLNNTRKNLRIVTHSDNQKNVKCHKDNKSGYKGVSFDKVRNKFSAEIQVNNKRIRLGRFETVSDAVCAYNNAATMYHREFARINK